MNCKTVFKQQTSSDEPDVLLFDKYVGANNCGAKMHIDKNDERSVATQAQ